MEKKTRVTSPKYQRIAADIASKIAKKHYQIGDKIYARSSIASQYGVSSETARRAISILTDLDIVDTIKGSGVKIKSYEKAVDFIRQFEDVQTVNHIKKEILESITKQEKELSYMKKNITNLIDKTDRFRSINPFLPFEIDIEGDTPYLNKTISESNFWQNTAATIIAIRRNNSMLLSPGPYAEFVLGDRVYFIGDDKSYDRVISFLYPNMKENK
ncbi:MAG: GntR family transcriptional regulator [Clostridiales bacterium]|nr:GntR family transcriptional regulator [Clostridiales bacterium]